MFAQFWAPTIAFAAATATATFLGLLPIRLRGTRSATAAEFSARASWSAGAAIWFAWTIPNMAEQFQNAMNRRDISNIWDPAELILRAFATPGRIDHAVDWWLAFAAVLLLLTCFDTWVFYQFHRRGSRIAARTISAAVTALIAIPVWPVVLVIVGSSFDVWRSIP